jgi:hypothetical protein
MTRLPVQPNESRPVISVNLEELKFWLSIMQEHALFIKAGLPANRKEAIQEAQEFYRCFGALLAKAGAISSDKKFKELVRQSTEKVEEFYRFKRRLLQLALRGELCGCLYPSLLDHMAREAEYFLRLLESMSDCKAFQLWPKTKELNFWVRLMSDHSDFIRQMLDPSEAILIETTEGFAGEFDELFRQSVDFSSMLRGANCSVPAFGRFLQDTRVAGMRLRDFQRGLHSMLEDKKVLGLITPLYADHVRREADHFLMVAAMLENDMQTSGYTGTNSVIMPMTEEDIETAMVDTTTAAANDCAAEAKLAALQQKSTQANSQAAAVNAQCQQNATFDSEVLEEIDDDEAIIATTVAPVNTPNSSSKAKYTWNSAWPRPLGEEKEEK